jgi:hypothetical protein
LVVGVVKHLNNKIEWKRINRTSKLVYLVNMALRFFNLNISFFTTLLKAQKGEPSPRGAQPLSERPFTNQRIFV